MREHILREIKRLASENGAAPGQKLFARDTGIAEHQWRGKFWPRWGDALIAAGYEPNKWTGRLDSEQVLTGIIEACRHYGRLPTRDEIEIYRKTESSIPSEQAIKRHFGRRSELVAVLAKYASENDGYTDIAAMLPPVETKVPRSESVGSKKKPDGWVYLFKSGDYYKIGRSDDLERRIKEVGIKLPEKLTPIHSIQTDDPPGIEAYWHRRFDSKRANGEWFKLSSADVVAFKKRKYQ